MQIVDYDLVGLRQAVIQRDLTPLEIANAYIERLSQVDPQINGMVQSKFDQFRQAAAAADHGFAEKPLMGLPFALKDCLEVEGWITSFGTKGYADHVSSFSATVVNRLQAAGGLLLGITNSPELGTSIETDNLIYGRTNNPLDLARAPGGSTGGGAALVKAKAIPFVIGSDFGGGSRNAAHCCGVFAHRPSFGRVSTAGYLFGCSGMKGQMCRIAPLARSIRDLELIFSVISGADPDDPKTDGTAARVSLGTAEPARVAIAMGCDLAPPEPETAAAIAAFGATLADSFGVTELDLNALIGEGNAIAKGLFSADAGRLLRTALENLGVSDEISPSMAFWLSSVGEVAEMPAGDFIQLLTRWENFRLSIHRLFEQHDFIILPTAPTVAPKHGETLVEGALWRGIAYSAPISLTESPVVVLPVGIGKDGLPVSVQVVGRKGEDERLLAFCRMIHETRGTAKDLIDSALNLPTVFD